MEKAISIAFPSPWGITSDLPLGSFKKTTEYLKASRFKDDGDDHSEINFIDQGTVHFFVPANNEEPTWIAVIVDGDKILAIQSAFKENPPTMAKGIIHGLWNEFTKKPPELEITRGATDTERPLWTGGFSTETVTGRWASEGLIKTEVSIAINKYADKLP